MVQDFCPITDDAHTELLETLLAMEMFDNIPEVLGRRGYGADTDVVLEITDPLSLAGGRFLLQTRDGVGKCTPHDGPPDVEMGLAQLTTIFTGAHRASQLSRAGRITELRAGTLRDLDATFNVERAPYCGTLFSSPASARNAEPSQRATLEGFRDFVLRQNACYCRNAVTADRRR